jgi:hypothetical protein
MAMLTGKLVGMHFRPPAKALLAVLPSGAEVRLTPEPDNPYDADAVKVEVRPRAGIAVALHERLAGEAMGFGFSVEEIVGPEAPEWFHVGYIDSKKTGMAAVFARALGGASAQGVLGFDASGWPLVMWQPPG